MTAQSTEGFFYEGDYCESFDCPLDSYRGLPTFLSLSTADIRGYCAVWSVVADRLYLVHLSGVVIDSIFRDMRLVFPNASAPVFACWFSGTLKLHRGREIHRGDFDMTSEIEIVLTVTKGQVTSKEEIRRECPPELPTFDPILFFTLEELVDDELPTERLRPLFAAGVRRIGDLVQVKELDLIRTYGIDLETAIVLRDLLAVRGLACGTYLHGWPPAEADLNCS